MFDGGYNGDNINNAYKTKIKTIVSVIITVSIVIRILVLILILTVREAAPRQAAREGIYNITCIIQYNVTVLQYYTTSCNTL